MPDLPTPGPDDVWGAALNAVIEEALGAVAWTALPLESGYVSNADSFGHPPQYRKVGDRVELRGVLRKASGSFTSNSQVTVATLPVGFRPSVIVLGSAAHTGSTSGNVGRLDANPDGTVRFLPAPSGVTWVALDGLSFSMTA